MKYEEWRVILEGVAVDSRLREMYADWTADKMRQCEVRGKLADSLKTMYTTASNEFYKASMALIDFAGEDGR